MQLHQQLLLATSILYTLGLVMIFNTSSAEAIDLLLDTKTHHALIKQLFYGLFGVSLAYCAYRVGYKKLFQLTPFAYGIVIFFLLLVFVPGLGISANGSRRWVNVFGMSLQPSEFAKYIVGLFFAYRLSQCDKSVTFKKFLQILGVASIPIFLIVIEPNNGTAGVCCAVVAMLCFVRAIPYRFWFIPFVCMALLGGLFAMQLPYVTKRLEVYLNPELDLQGKGHQPHQARIAAGSGGLFGKGPGKSLQKFSYLPEAQNDYIAAIFAEEFGFIGMLFLLGMYVWIASIGFVTALRAQDIEGMYVAVIFAFLTSFQAFLNLGVVSAIVPSTGLNLPFFSQGGSSLLANIGAVGIVYSIASTKKERICLKPL